jgi:hypothetical protein
MSGSDAPGPAQPLVPKVAELEYLWQEYRYRHDLCWRAIYQVAAAVIALAALPYVRDELTKVLGQWMLVPPAVGAALAAFGILVLSNELDIFAKSKLAHHTLQDVFLSHAIGDPRVREFVLHGLTPDKVRHTRFDRYATSFMIMLLVLSVGNVLFLWLRWIPHLSEL